MRRFGSGAQGESLGDHLDPDEMNTFAEGALPPAARSRYVSHLADCDQCRRQVAQLSITAGAVVRSEQSAAARPESRSVWQMLIGIFALPVLRYVAFAAVVLGVAGVAYLALRPRSEQKLVASSEPLEQHPASALKAPAIDNNGNTQTNAAQSSSSPTVAATPSTQNPKREDLRVAENIVPPVAAKQAPLPSISTESKAGESQAYKALPSYAPPPPGESQATTQEQRSAAGGASYSQKKAETAGKVDSADRERDLAKDAVRADEPLRPTYSGQPTSVTRKATDEKQKGGPSRNVDNLANRTQNEVRNEPAKARTGGDKQSSDDESSETRSVGGHKFRRQGRGWIDQKFKSSMAMKNISRGSDEFKELDSRLQSIAQQLSGQVIVVWKGQAYLISK